MDIYNQKLVEDVKKIAKNAHVNQTRNFGEDKGKSYFDTHITRVALKAMNKGANEDQFIAAWLHDLKEDQPKVWDEDVLRKVGVSENTLEIVDALTKKEGENYFDFIQRIIKTPDAIVVKIADIEDNMFDLKEGSMKDKYRFALHMLVSEKNCNDWVRASNEGNV